MCVLISFVVGFFCLKRNEEKNVEEKKHLIEEQLFNENTAEKRHKRQKIQNQEEEG